MSEEKARDDNDLAKAGELPDDPEDGTRLVADGPRLTTVRDMLRGAYKSATNPRQKRAATTGSYKLDNLTGGLRAGFTWVLLAETSWGKTSHTIEMADENLKRGGRVLIVSCEDAPAVYGARLLARRARVNANRLRDGKLEPDEISRAMAAVERAEPVPVYLDAIGKSAEWILRQLPMIVRAYGIDVVVIDYLQVVHTIARHEDRRLALAWIADQFRACIKQLGVTGVLVSQLTPQQGVKPSKYSVRDSKDIVHGAEVVAVGYYTEEGAKTRDGIPIPAHSRAICIDKNKDGPLGSVILNWDEDCACFRDDVDKAYDGMSDMHDRLDDFDELDRRAP
jgi:replicative DNA helicase